MAFEIDTFDDAIDYVISMIGSNFERSLQIAEAVLENPGDYTGRQAATAAVQLSVHRYKIGVAAQYWKKRSTASKRDIDRMVKDALMLSYDATKDIVDALKKVSTLDNELASMRRPLSSEVDDD